MASPVRSALTRTASSSGAATGWAPTAAVHPASWRALKRRASAFRARSTSATSPSRAARSHSSCSRSDQLTGPSSTVPATLSHTAASWPSGRVGHRHLGQQHGQDRVLPRVEQRQQQALLAAEVGVDRTRGPAGGLGHGVDRHRIDALFGEELGGGGQQARPCLGLALLLGLRHVPPDHRAARRSGARGDSTYIGSVMQLGGATRPRARPADRPPSPSPPTRRSAGHDT